MSATIEPEFSLVAESVKITETVTLGRSTPGIQADQPDVEKLSRTQCTLKLVSTPPHLELLAQGSNPCAVLRSSSTEGPTTVLVHKGETMDLFNGDVLYLIPNHFDYRVKISTPNDASTPKITDTATSSVGKRSAPETESDQAPPKRQKVDEKEKSKETKGDDKKSSAGEKPLHPFFQQQRRSASPTAAPTAKPAKPSPPSRRVPTPPPREKSPATSGSKPSPVASPTKASSSTSTPASSGGATALSNQELAKMLDELGRTEKNQGESYKATAYFKAAKAIRAHPTPITSGHEAKALPGVGTKIAAKIDEFLAHGVIGKLEAQQSDEKTVARNLVARVWGIGPATVRKLVDEQGVRSLEDLAKVKLNRDQQIGLKYFEEFETKIPRDEIKLLEAIVRREAVAHVDPNVIVQICGSYRRGLPSSGDIDVLMTVKPPAPGESVKIKSESPLHQLVARLHAVSFITDDLTAGGVKTKYMGVCMLPDSEEQFKPHIHRRIDIRYVPYENFFASLLYFTGSDNLNRQMRVRANEKGYTLNEYGLFKGSHDPEKDKPLEVHSERDIFDAIGMEFVEPERRSL